MRLRGLLRTYEFRVFLSLMSNSESPEPPELFDMLFRMQPGELPNGSQSDGKLRKLPELFSIQEELLTMPLEELSAVPPELLCRDVHMPPDEFLRWLKECSEASEAKCNSLIWQYAAAYKCQQSVRDDDELMKIPLFRHVFLAVSERFDRLLEAAKTDQRLAVALCRARSALREENYFRWANIVIDALEQYWDLRHKLGHPPTDNEVLDEMGFHREPGYETWKRQAGRALKAIRRVRGYRSRLF
jgi:hypothetical protein